MEIKMAMKNKLYIERIEPAAPAFTVNNLDTNEVKKVLLQNRDIDQLVLKQLVATSDQLPSVERTAILETFNDLLNMPDLYSRIDWRNSSLPSEALSLISSLVVNTKHVQKLRRRMPEAENREINWTILKNLYSGAIHEHINDQILKAKDADG